MNLLSRKPWKLPSRLAVIFWLSWLGPAEALSQEGPRREMALTFDDLPLNGADMPLPRVEEMTSKILAALSGMKAPAVGLVNEQKLWVEGELEARKGILSKWLDAGAELGNHTFSHPSLNRTDPQVFIEDILKGEAILRPLLAARGENLIYFRHPYLHTGLQIEVRAQVESFLGDRGYQIAPVTMENADWLFNAALLQAEKNGQQEIAETVISAYLDYTDEMIRFFEQASLKVLGTPIPQVMLLHANLLNSRALGALLERVRARGYEFISLRQALRHPAYSRQDVYLGEAGVNWIFRWDISDGKRDVDWRTEPTPPAFVDELYRGRP